MSRAIDENRLDQAYYATLLQIDTRYSDMDAMRHLNNVAIARIYESARARFHVNAFNVDFWKMPQQGGIVLAQANLRYFKEGFFPDPVTVGCRAVHIGNSSYTLHQALFQNEQCIGLCDAVFVYVQDGKSTPLPEYMREGLLNNSEAVTPHPSS